MTTRIDKRFAELRNEGRAALVTFLMCGDPDLDTSLQLIEALGARQALPDLLLDQERPA